MTNEQLLAKVKGMLEAQTKDWKRDLASQTLHFDSRFTRVENQVTPMYQLFIARKVNRQAIKWWLAIIASLTAIGTALKAFWPWK